MRVTLGGLWRHPYFLKLWAGQMVSLLGSEVTRLALPLTAVLVLGAGPGQIGLLHAVGAAPYLLVMPFAGVWVDRRRRRPVLAVADVGRAALLGSIPLAAGAGALRLEHLYAVAGAVGVLTLLFDQAYLPALVLVAYGDRSVEARLTEHGLEPVTTTYWGTRAGQ